MTTTGTVHRISEQRPGKRTNSRSGYRILGIQLPRDHQNTTQECLICFDDVPKDSIVDCPSARHQTDAPGCRHDPWLCYGGGSGFGGYCSYDGKRLHRRTRVWELETSTGSLKTWTRLEYAADRVDELVLVISGVVVEPPGKKMSSATDDLTCVSAPSASRASHASARTCIGAHPKYSGMAEEKSRVIIICNSDAACVRTTHRKRFVTTETALRFRGESLDIRMWSSPQMNV
jgi:hypothetical protein